MLQINVSQLLKSPIGATRGIEVADTLNINGGGGAARGEVELVYTGRGILVRGRLEIVVEASCCRCLSPFSLPLTINIEEEYIPAIDINSGLSPAADDEADSFSINQYHILDLTEAIRQYTILATPMKPLCRQDCTGNKTAS